MAGVLTNTPVSASFAGRGVVGSSNLLIKANRDSTFSVGKIKEDTVQFDGISYVFTSRLVRIPKL
jgi:hypothetical protein